jgi:hypothetical protein
MIRRYLTRGIAAGALAGTLFGLFVALVGTPLVGAVEATTHAHHHAAGAGHVVPDPVTAVASIGGGLLWGLLLGGIFGAVYYLFEPSIPGPGRSKAHLLAAAGFVTVSGAPWLLFPPRPPGVEAALPIGTRLAWYGVMAAAGALACGLAALTYRRLAARFGRPAVLAALAPLAVLAVPLALAPATAAGGDVPASVAATYRAVVAAGQAGLWLALATAHAWLEGRGSERMALAHDDPLPAD